MSPEIAVGRSSLNENGARPPAPDFVLGPLTTIPALVGEVFRYSNRLEKSLSLANRLRAYSDRLFTVWEVALSRVLTKNPHPVEYTENVTVQAGLFEGFPTITLRQTRERENVRKQVRFIYGPGRAGQTQLRMVQYQQTDGEQTQEITIMLGYSSGKVQVEEIYSRQTGQGSIVFSPHAT